jgi:dihydrolipoamide dehydrogenase
MAGGADAFDLIVIGSGPGGYVAAIRAAQLGVRTACVEKRATLGGTCLNVGCIPSKALLHSTELLAEARNGLAEHGIRTGEVTADLAAMMARKDKVVEGFTKGVEGLFRKNKVTWLRGTAAIKGKGEVAVTPETGEAETYRAKAILIATGSETARLPGIEIDETRIVSSTGALSLPGVPEHLVVIGGGYIGLEMGSVWRRLGAEVTVIEFLDSILPAMDAEVARQMHRLLEKQGLRFRLGTKVTAARAAAKGVTLTLSPAKGGAEETMTCDVVLVAVGRVPHTEGLGLAGIGVERDNKGRIKTDGHFRTSVEGVYAIGDAIAGPMLAHKAMDEGEVAAEIIAGQSGHVNYDAIPSVVYTFPEVAAVGRTEEELKAAGIEYRAGRFPMMANSRARTNATPDGFVKILADARTDRVLGVHIVAADAGTLIAELALAMEFGASAEDVARTCHAHPTLNEAVKEAALGVARRAIHI